MVSVLLVDDQPLVRTGFQMILETEDDVHVVGSAGNGAEALEVARRERPDVTLMDVQMPVMDGIEATRAIVAEGLSRVVVLTTFDRDDYLFDALGAGASGFLLKNVEPDRLVEAIHCAANGQALLSPEVTKRVISRMSPAQQAAVAPGTPAAAPGAQVHVPDLTEREREVLVLVAEGLSNAEIAARLYVGEATVKTHVSNLLAKLGLRDRVQAVVWAHRAGLAG